MKNSIAINLLALLFVFALKVPLEADWKADWERTVEAAKKEGRLNLYVGRYGQAPLLEEFKDEYPEIRSQPGLSRRRESKREDRASRLSKEVPPLPTQTLNVADP
jgi:hypothetical protein